MKELRKGQQKVSLENLIQNGRNLTIEHYFEIKKEFDADPKAQEQLMRDR